MRSALMVTALFLTTPTFSQHLEGQVLVDLETGIFKCNFTVSGLSDLGRYQILLNHGMNIKYFQDSAGEPIYYDGFYDGQTKGEAIVYYFVDDQGEVVSPPATFDVAYSGAFPIYDSSYNWFDFKGYIAINDQTIRATEQTKWYPVIYDPQNDRIVDRYTYRITVQAKNCRNVFINGNPPKAGEQAVFSSSKAVPLFLFAGNYDYLEVNGDYLINIAVSDETATKIFRNIDEIKQFYAAKFEEQFEDNIYIINHRAVKNMGRGNWGFNVYPAFGFANLDFNELLTEEGAFKDHQYRFFGHELAHNYFGGNVISGLLYWFWLESCAEYLSFFVIDNFVGPKYLNERLLNYATYLKDKSFTPLSEVKKADELTDDYRYLLGPLILKCFELQFGEEKTIATLKRLLRISQSAPLTVSTWQKAAIESQISEAEFRKFEKQFLASAKFTENVIEYIEQSTPSPE